MAKTRVLVTGLDPNVIDPSDPAYGFRPGFDAAILRESLDAEIVRFTALGYEAELCPVDFGDTAEAVLLKRLGKKRFDCVVIGAGVRLIAQNTSLFEKLVNIVHEHAPQAKLCFNTKPTDTVEAVQRWFSEA